MLHTFLLTINIPYDEFKSIDKALFNATKRKPSVDKWENNNYSVKTFTYKLIPDCEVEFLIKKFKSPKYQTFYKFMVIINPAKIVHRDFINTSDKETADMAISQLNSLFNKLKIRYSCSDFEVHRMDYAYNCNLNSMDRADKYLKLIKKGDIPDGFTVYKEFSPTGHRFISPKSSFYCYNGSVTINFYNKYAQMTNAQEDGYYYDVDIDKAKGILRFEVQCHNPKINTIKEVYNIPDKSVGWYLNKKISIQTLKYYTKKVCCAGDYCTYDEARKQIQANKLKSDEVLLMFRLLELVNKKRNGLYKSKSILRNEGYSYKQVKDIISKFDGLNVNPVTIPEKWNIEKMSNPIKLLFG